MASETVRDVLTRNPMATVRLWCDDDGVWVALPESGPYPGPNDSDIDIDQIPIAVGRSPHVALSLLLTSPSRLPLEVSPC